MFTKLFWRAAAERAVKSAAQGVILLGIGSTTVNALKFDWATAGGSALGMAALSILTSLASSAVTDKSGPSLTDAEVLPSHA